MKLIIAKVLVLLQTKVRKRNSVIALILAAMLGFGANYLGYIDMNGEECSWPSYSGDLCLLPELGQPAE